MIIEFANKVYKKGIKRTIIFFIFFRKLFILTVKGEHETSFVPCFRPHNGSFFSSDAFHGSAIQNASI